MSNQNYIYAPAPELAENIRCKVPMKGSRQLFTIDGGIQGTGRPVDITFEGQDDEILQIIGVRTDKHPEFLSFDEKFTFKENSLGRLILCEHTFTQASFETEEEISISVERGAAGNIVVMQNEHNNASHRTSFHIDIAADASLRLTFITLHGGKIENDVVVSLNERHASCDINGIYLVDGKQTVRNNVNILHKVPECESHQLFKGILDNSSSSYFRGLVKVFPDAQKTEAYQENHNLILTDKARAYSEPLLEIYADDVKCTHGATNGRLDENELFYLRSRGISEKEARLLQQLAFAHSVIEKISSDELRERMINMVEQRLRGEFSNSGNSCSNCC